MTAIFRYSMIVIAPHIGAVVDRLQLTLGYAWFDSYDSVGYVVTLHISPFTVCPYLPIAKRAFLLYRRIFFTIEYDHHGATPPTNTFTAVDLQYSASIMITGRSLSNRYFVSQQQKP